MARATVLFPDQSEGVAALHCERHLIHRPQDGALAPRRPGPTSDRVLHGELVQLEKGSHA
jgi:hypothetical protein